jgi:hypothetical protein
MTWDDDSSEAKIAIEAMWDGVIDAANDYLVAHPTATPHQIQSALTAIKPVADRRIALPPNVTALKLRPELFAVSFSDDPASIVFVLHPQPGKPQVWRIDTRRHKQKTGAAISVHGKVPTPPMHAAIRSPKAPTAPAAHSTPTLALCQTRPRAPRFYIDASYSKDMGALFLNQTSIWRWDGDHAELLWIDAYNLSAGGE